MRNKVMCSKPTECMWHTDHRKSIVGDHSGRSVFQTTFVRQEVYFPDSQNVMADELSRADANLKHNETVPEHAPNLPKSDKPSTILTINSS